MAVTWTGIGGITSKMAQARRGMKAGTVALAASHAARGERAMKANAPWSDRTSNARQGLFGESEETADGAVIVLGGTVEYQPYLELGTSRMAPRPIILPTAQVTQREVSEDMIKLAQRFGR